MKKLLIALTMISLTANAEVKKKKEVKAPNTVERVQQTVTYTFSEGELQSLLNGQATVIKLSSSIEQLIQSKMKIDSVVVVDTIKEVAVVDTAKVKEVHIGNAANVQIGDNGTQIIH